VLVGFETHTTKKFCTRKFEHFKIDQRSILARGLYAPPKAMYRKRQLQLHQKRHEDSGRLSRTIMEHDGRLEEVLGGNRRQRKKGEPAGRDRKLLEGGEGDADGIF
jgi:hypothetical protein